MATLISSGVGSGLDVTGLVTQLVAAERAPLAARLTRTDAKLTTEFTALSQLKGSLSTFQSAVAGLKDVDSLVLRKASSSDDTLFTGTAGSSAAAGGYSIEVMQLATASQLSSAAFAAGSTATVGTGTLTLSQGSTSIELTIDSTNNTLAGIRDAINGATGNPGIRATLINAADGTRLVISGGAPGAANAVTVAAAGGDGGLAQLATASLSVITPAQDAQVKVAGFTINSPTNSVAGAIDGVTLQLKKAAPGTLATFSVINDDAAVQTKAENFVKAYNTLAGQLTKLRAYDPKTESAGPLIGDAMLMGLESSLRRMVGEVVAGAGDKYGRLSSVGISTGVDGTLSLDATKFRAALADDPSAVGRLFGGTDGVAGKLNTFLARQLGSEGEIALRDAGITARRKDLEKRSEALDARMASIQARYLKQFNSLDTLLSRMQSTATYLTQQLSSSTQLAKNSGK